MSAANVTGVLLVALPLAFNASFSLLAARFDYPGVLRRPTSSSAGSGGMAGTSPPG
jgi:hypothetical protein